MRYYYTDGKWWYVGFAYDATLVKEVKQFAGAGYNPMNKEWYIPVSLVNLSKVKQWLAVNGFVEEVVYTPLKRVIDYVEPETIVTAEDVALACKQMAMLRTPRPYQCEGVAYMINHGNCINGDDCGLGKTAQTIIAIEMLGLFPALIITPASVKFNWKKEWSRWVAKRSVGVVDGKDTAVWDNDVVVINYDILGQRASAKPTLKYKELTKRGWQACVIDEIHFLKNGKALRTKLVKKIAGRILNVWGLTGTLTQNRPSDLIEPYKVLRRFDEMFGSTLDFKFRYCNAHKTIYGLETDGFCNLEELHEMLRMGGYIRRNKSEVLKELPPVTEQQIDVPLTNRKEYTLAENSLLDYLNTIDVEKATNAVNAPYLVMMNTLKLLTIKGKMQFITSYIEEWLAANENEQALVFGVHRENLQALAAQFDSPLIQGGTPLADRQKIVEAFASGRHRLLFANILSAGTGMDGMQERCSNVFYIELPDRSTDLEQATSRIERMGQKQNITVTYFISPETIDVDMLDIIKDKSLITGVVNQGEREQALLVKKFYKKHREISEKNV